MDVRQILWDLRDSEGVAVFRNKVNSLMLEVEFLDECYSTTEFNISLTSFYVNYRGEEDEILLFSSTYADYDAEVVLKSLLADLDGFYPEEDLD